jgi:hypothetical protein
MSTSHTHNLKIQSYSLEDILGLFSLSFEFDVEDLKRAKKQVLMIHPDKSKLPSEYFIFYKRAFEIIVQFHTEKTRQSQRVPTEPIIYNKTSNIDSDSTVDSKSTHTHINGAIQKMGPVAFNSSFNALFEKNMAKKIDEEKNEWFKNENPVYNVDSSISAPGNLRSAMDTLRTKQSGVIQFREVEMLHCGNTGSNLYDEVETDGLKSEYFECDPFSKLKFEDLRKVHKDRSIFSVSESDLSNVKMYNSVEQFVKERGSNITPLDKSQSEQLMNQNKMEYERNIMKKQYASKIQSMEYAQKNKSVLSAFLHISN